LSVGRPLEGVRVVELTTHVAAPSCGRLIADWGADVIKVESLKGDDLRSFGVTYGMTATEDENPFYDQLNCNKRDIALNIKTKEGKEILYKLLATADVFLTNNRHQALVRNGLDYASLKERFPRLIFATITGYGDYGPDKDRPGMDTAAFWGRSGFLTDLTIASDTSQPVAIPSGMGDLIASGQLFAGIACALYSREKTGVGDAVTISLYGTAAWVLNCMTVATQPPYNRKYPRTRLQTSPTPYKTKDGEWIIPSILVGFDKNFPALCNSLGLTELLEDDRYNVKSSFAKPENLAKFIEMAEEKFATKTAEEWVPILNENGANYSVLGHMKDILFDEQAIVNGFVGDMKMRSGNTCRITNPPLRTANKETIEVVQAPKLGQHTLEIMQELGYSEEAVRELCENGVMKDNP